MLDKGFSLLLEALEVRPFETILCIVAILIVVVLLLFGVWVEVSKLLGSTERENLILLEGECLVGIYLEEQVLVGNLETPSLGSGRRRRSL